jgi:WD40 repeat protein
MLRVLVLLILSLLNTTTILTTEDEFSALQPITLENVSNLVRLERQIPQLQGIVKAISPDSSMIVTLHESDLTLWRFPSGEKIISIPVTAYRVTTVKFIRDGKRLAVSSDKLQILNIETGEVVVLLEGYPIVDIAFTPDEQWIASARGADWICYECPDEAIKQNSLRNNIIIQELDSGKIVTEIWREEGANRGFSGIDFSSDGQLLAATASRENLFVWEFKSLLKGDLEPSIDIPLLQQTSDVAFSPDDSQIAVSYGLLYTGGDAYATIPFPTYAQMWKVDLLKKSTNNEKPSESSIKFTGWGHGVRTIDYLDDGNLIFAHGEMGWVTFWNAKTGDEVFTLKDQVAAAITDDERLVITSDVNGNISYWGVVK